MHDANGASCLAAIRTWLEVVRSEEHSSTWIKQYPRFSKCWLNWYLEACRIWVNLEDLFPSINSVETYLLPIDDLLSSNSIQLFLPNLLQFGLHVREGVRVEFELNLSFWNSDISLVWKLYFYFDTAEQGPQWHRIWWDIVFELSPFESPELDSTESWVEWRLRRGEQKIILCFTDDLIGEWWVVFIFKKVRPMIS